MANRKLKASLDLDTSEARRKLRRDLSEAASGAGSGGGGGGVPPSLDRMAQSADKAAASFGQVDRSALRLTRGFAGIAVGLATSYAANYVDNPNAKAALGYAGNALAGAAAGAMFGGIPGAIIGGAAGVVKTYMDNEGERSAMSKDFEQSEAIYAAVRKKNAKFLELSNTKDGADIAGNLAEAKKTIENYTASTADFVARVREELKKMNPDKELIAKLRRKIDYNRGEIQRYEGLVRNLEEIQRKAENQPTARASLAALDSISKVGGIGSGVIAAEKAAEEAAQQAAGQAAKEEAEQKAKEMDAGGPIAFDVPVTPSQDTAFGDSAAALADGVDAAIKSANEHIEKIDADQLQVLKEIAEILKGNGGTVSWQ